MVAKLTNDEWVKRANKIHGSKYEYPISKWGDINSKSLVEITCPEHGGFFQSMSNHTHVKSPTGCPVCSHTRQPSREERISQAVDVHGDKYDYSLWPLEISASTRVETKCIECDKTWFHNVDNHVRGRGCPNCKSRIKIEKTTKSKSSVINKRLLRNKELLQEANLIHFGKYDYSRLDPLFNVKSTVPVICRDHGVFYTTMYNHVKKGSSCPVCVNGMMSEKHALGFDKWVNVLSEIHPDYIFKPHKNGSNSAKDKIRVKCPDHGWWTTSIDSLKVSGCPACKGHCQKYLYVNIVDGTFIKYGIAVNPELRLKKQNRVNRLKSELLMLFEFDNHDDCRRSESEIKSIVKQVSNRFDMTDGWSETANIRELDVIMNIAIDNGGKKVSI
jgi:hypothetical protein